MNEEELAGGTARERLDVAREAYERAREVAREARTAERTAEREARQLAREAARDARDAVREHRHQMRHEVRGMGFGPGHLNLELGELGDLLGGQEYSDTVEKTFTVGAKPSLIVRNVSGYTHVSVGASGEISVRARKRVRGTSEERAKRLLENVEVRMEQDMDEVTVKPHLYEQDRGWLDLFRGGRVAVDIDLTVPRDIRIEAHSVSGDLGVTGTRGSLEIQTMSGDASVDDVQGQLRIKTVSGDGTCRRLVGQLEANSVSGDLIFKDCSVRAAEIVSVSGDVELEGELSAGSEHYVKTISGDIDLGLTGDSYDVKFKTLSGDLECELDARVEREDRRDRRVRIGAGEVPIRVKTVSGDLQLRRSRVDAPPPRQTPETREGSREGSEAANPPMAPQAPKAPEAPMVPGAPELARPAEPPVAAEAPMFPDVSAKPGEPRTAVAAVGPEGTEPQRWTAESRGGDVRGLLELVARGEMAVEDAAAAIDATRSRGKQG